MNLFQHLHGDVVAALAALAADGALPAGLDAGRISVEPPREAGHGDVTTNAAMVLAKQAKMKPRDIADLLAPRLGALETVTDTEIAGPGFINLRLADSVWLDELAAILGAGASYGDSEMGGGEPVNVEYVSANPTGPLHVGHGRGAVVGDALASLLQKAGYAVTREYWVNDAGAQVEALARSLHYRYQEALGGDPGEPPEGFYPGDYLVAVGRSLVERDGDKWSAVSEGEWMAPLRDFAVEAMMAVIRDDLDTLGVAFDVFTRESGFVESGGVDSALEVLAGRDLIYTGVLEPPKGKTPDDWEPRPQTLFRASQFGDDVDRPLKKSDGSWTYFATDIAYHLDKFRRGFRTMINVWGADHGGYVKRLDAAVEALTEGAGDLDVKLCQMVNLLDGGEPVKMSKRAGTFVTVKDVVEKVGRDVVRFIMLTRKNDAQLEFDLARSMEQSRDNPVFYVQYAHARIRSVMRLAAEKFSADALRPAVLAEANLERLTDSAELGLIKVMADWPRLIENAAAAHEPHRVAFYLHDLASLFHGLWNKGKDDAALRFLAPEDDELTVARLALLQGVAFVITSGLSVFGVTPVEEMR
jgi:arginyl-tRNA synthetase